MRTGEHFDSKRDKATVETGGFFCHVCLVGKPMDEKSPDPRYCRGCYEYLLKEEELLTGTKRPKWISNQETVGGKSIPVPKAGAVILTTVSNINLAVAKISASTTDDKSAERRGRRQMNLPVDYIQQLVEAGLGYKKIASRLSAECGRCCCKQRCASD